VKTIYKYMFDINNKIELPKEAVFLDAGVVNSQLNLWFMVETENEVEERSFEIFGTGWDMNSDIKINRQYLKTVYENHYVWHILERKI